MDWKALLDELVRRGWTQKLIAQQLGAGQGTISDIYTGKTKCPSFALGEGLRRLQLDNVQPPSASPAGRAPSPASAPAEHIPTPRAPGEHACAGRSIYTDRNDASISVLERALGQQRTRREDAR